MGLTLSVIVPVHNGSATLRYCLDALGQGLRIPDQLIVVDDASSDDSAEIAKSCNATLASMRNQCGPAAARNLGSQIALGDVLVFIDADCVVHHDTLAQIEAVLTENEVVSALFGSYDNAPAASNFMSQYKNLTHHFVHQQSPGKVATFWAGCGAVRADVFAKVGRFDAQKYPEPSIEDIELGYRLTQAGYETRLVPTIQVTHHKRWTLGSMLRTDIFARAFPWSTLLAETDVATYDLNISIMQRLSALLVWLFVALSAMRLAISVPILGLFLLLNRRYFTYLQQLRGTLFAACAVPLQLIYFLYSSAIFVCVRIGRG